MKVAVVDDDARVRQLLAEELEDAGCAVWSCAGAEELLAPERAAERAALDLVLLDLTMPRIDGLSCLRRLRADGHRGRVVMVSALCDPAQRQALLAAGADGYVLKTELLAGVEALLAGLEPG